MLHRPVDLLHNLQRLHRLTYQIVDNLGDFTYRLRGLVRQRADLCGYHRKALAALPGAGSLNGRIQRQQIRLVRNRVNQPCRLLDGIRSLVGGFRLGLHAHHIFLGAHIGLYQLLQLIRTLLTQLLHGAGVVSQIRHFLGCSVDSLRNFIDLSCSIRRGCRLSGNIFGNLLHRDIHFTDGFLHLPEAFIELDCHVLYLMGRPGNRHNETMNLFPGRV